MLTLNRPRRSGYPGSPATAASAADAPPASAIWSQRRLGRNPACTPCRPPTRAHGVRGPFARFGRLLHRYFLPALLAVYALGRPWRPGPGAVIREFAVTLPGGGQERASMLLLAVLLFCAAAVIEWSQVRDLLEHPSVLLAGLLTCWFGPALLVVVVGPLLPRLVGGDATAGLLVGLALVAAMPVANSSAGWTQNAGGNVTLSLGLIVLSILLSPLATPNLLKLMGLVLSADDTHRIEQVVTQFSGWRFILWVILPSLAGAAAAWLAGPQRIARAKPWFRLITLVDILVLNYANASLAVEKILDQRASGRRRRRRGAGRRREPGGRRAGRASGPAVQLPRSTCDRAGVQPEHEAHGPGPGAGRRGSARPAAA